jgi:tryptophanyl-tRNA synthetase
MRKRILTGDRPTGALHLGHYVGSLANRVRLQDEYETYILIADVQALTDNFKTPELVRKNIRQVALDYLAVGLDPNKVSIVIQSMVPEIAELTIFYMNLVSVARLQRNPTVKDEMKQKGYGSEVPAGFLCYPISQAADITFVQAHLVPVGQDQMPVIEQTREIVRSFNRLYGEDTIVEPNGLVGEVERLPGTDGKAKMSKSLGNVVCLSDPTEVVKKQIMSMYTDPTRLRATDPGHVEGNPCFTYHDCFNENKAEVAELKERYTAGKVGDVEVKKRLFEALEKFLTPMREKRAEYEKRMDDVDDILIAGTKAARVIAGQTMDKVRQAMKIDYFAK